MNKCKHCNSENTTLKIEKLSNVITHHKLKCNQCNREYHIPKTKDNLYNFNNINSGLKVNEKKFNNFFS